MAWLGVYPDHDAIFRSADWKLSRAKIDDARFDRIKALLARPSLLIELEALTSRSEPYSDFEEVSLLFGEEEYRFICREVTPNGTLLELLHELRGIADFRIGDRPFVGEPCTSAPPN
jgi:hypothetical protein